MRKKMLLTLAFSAIAAATVAFSPKPLSAEDSSSCACNGGCEDLQNYNYCGGGLCSWFCTVNQT